MVPESSLRTRLRWSRPEKTFGILESYIVNICKTLGPCDTAETLSDCADHVTTETETVFDSVEDTSYCVLIAAKARCGVYEISSRQVNAKIRTPLFELPDVSNLTTAGIKNGYITLSWRRPQGRFDYYSIEVMENGSRIRPQHKIGLCANGTIIRPDQTQLTCGPFEQCSTLSYSMRTHLNGPEGLSSPGVVVKDIFIPPQAPPDVPNLHLVSVGANHFTAAWTKPKFNFDYYWIEVIGVKNAYTRETPGMAGSCFNGSIIHPDQTQVTCSQLEPCSKVNFKVRTHINGPPARTSHGVSLHDILIPASVRPQVANLQLGALNADTFVLKWKRPQACFDYYTVEVVDESTYKRTAVTCNNGDVINPNHTSVTCDQIKTCANVTIRVKTHTRGPPERSSTGAVLRHVFLQGKAPPEPTNLKLVFRKGR
ncbi:hypothetical protein MTO96_034513 [Rhipicephalus appendiculatus]